MTNFLRTATVAGERDDGNKLVQFHYEGIFLEVLERLGKMPLPPYIKEKLADKERYQTVYSKIEGSAAAPTAGLHFTPELIQKLKDMGVEFATVLLHIGLGTFRPVKEENILDHEMHTEYYEIDEENAEKINKATREGRRVICVGTTSVRTLETVADENGDLGPVYGKQWRAWQTADGRVIDQISQVITQIKENPDSRRLLVSAWNVGEIEKMALPPCHIVFQFYVARGRLSCQLYQRSADVFLGVPFNIASYALLTHMAAQVCGLQVGEFIHTLGDAHLYLNHIEQAKLQLTRQPLPLPTLKLNPFIHNIFDFKYGDIAIEHYNAHPHIKAPVSK